MKELFVKNVVKLTDENLEKLRDTCSNVRDLAILELLISTGMRVGELTKLIRYEFSRKKLYCFR